jgi:signal transduction histidine kinase
MLRIFRTENFKLVLFYASLFSASVFILGMVVFFNIRSSIEHPIRTHIEQDVAQLMGDYHDDGIDELRHDIRERIETNPSGRLLYSIQGPDGRVIFDDLAHFPNGGWHSTRAKDGTKLLLLSTPLREGYNFSVAANMEKAGATQTAVRNAFATAFILMLFFGVSGGLILSKRFLARVDHFTRIAEGIGSQASLSQRLPLSGSKDDFDHLALIVNSMLNRIEHLVREIRQVTTNVAHDLRTPLGRIRQKMELLSAQQEIPEKYRAQIEEVISLLDETMHAFSAILRIAEIESGSRAAFSQVDLSEILNHVANAYAPSVEEHGYVLLTRIEKDCMIHGDKSLLQQLFSNLIENALRHTNPGTRIQIEAQKMQDQIQVLVSDNGPGVPESERKNILKPFYRLDKSRSGIGSGLGLSLVSAIASLHHAKLTLGDNQPGLKITLLFDPVSSQNPEIPGKDPLQRDPKFHFAEPLFGHHIWDHD